MKKRNESSQKIGDSRIGGNVRILSDAELAEQKVSNSIIDKNLSMSAMTFSASESVVTPSGQLLDQEGKMSTPDNKCVFVIYGRNSDAHQAIVSYLQALGLRVLDFNALSVEAGSNAYIGDIIQLAMKKAYAVVSLFTPDEYACLQPPLRKKTDKDEEVRRFQARQNVVLETGLALGVSKSRTVIVSIGDVAIPSDLAGIHVVRLNDSPESRNFLKDKLKEIGVDIHQGGNMYKAGKFDDAIKEVVLPLIPFPPDKESRLASPVSQPLILLSAAMLGSVVDTGGLPERRLSSVTDVRPLASASRFEGVYCSGLFAPDGATVTAMTLLFDRVHFLNHAEFVSEFARRYRVVGTVSPDEINVDPEWPFANLDAEQQKTARWYLRSAGSFFVMYRKLLPEIFTSSMIEDVTNFYAETSRKVTGMALIESRPPPLKNLYRATVEITLNGKLMLQDGAVSGQMHLIDSGAVPIFSRLGVPILVGARSPSARQIASLLAIKSVQMILPAVRKADPEVLLEARYRLRDQLPAFWASMLKLSNELDARIVGGVANFDQECTDLVDRIVRPALIDLAYRMEKERRSWFYRILTYTRDSLHMLIARPPRSITDLAALSASSRSVRGLPPGLQIEALSYDPGLGYLLEVGSIHAGSGHRRRK